MRIALVNPTWSFGSSLCVACPSPQRLDARREQTPGEPGPSHGRPHSCTFCAETGSEDADRRHAPPPLEEIDRLIAHGATRLDEVVPRAPRVALCACVRADDPVRLRPSSPYDRRSWGARDGRTRKGACVPHRGRFDRSGDIPSAAPAPLRELEAACCPA